MTVETRSFETKEIQGDMMTPISIYHALNGQNKMLFESSAKHEESGRYSFIVLNPVAEIKGNQYHYIFTDEHRKEHTGHGILEKLKTILPEHKEQYPFSFFGGMLGYFGYETAFYSEQIGEYLPDDLNMPDIHALFYDTFLIYDHLKQTITIAAIDLFQSGRTSTNMLEAINKIYKDLQAGASHQEVKLAQKLSFKPSIQKEDFKEMVEKAKQHIVQGDIFQVVISQRFRSPFTGNPFSLYRQLRTSNPSPYMFYMDFGKYVVFGTSPESLVKVKNGYVTTNPIAGTKPRGKSPEEDQQIAASLLIDEKEVAEHRMLVDLGRNDIGKISEIGTVQVNKYMQIELYKYVMHIVSEVTGRLRKDTHAFDVLAACLPAGTVSGAPKIRAMQIINELESIKRGVYAGAVGYISVTGDMDLALAIRTMIVKDQMAHVQAGAGIVFDSIPENEYEETLNKAKALLEVIR